MQIMKKIYILLLKKWCELKENEKNWVKWDYVMFLTFCKSILQALASIPTFCTVFRLTPSPSPVTFKLVYAINSSH